MLDLGSAVGYLLLDTSGFEKGVNKATSSFKTLMDSNSTANDKLQATKSIMEKTGANLTKYVALPVAGVAAASLAMASDFESSMKKLQAATGATSEEMKKFENVVRGVYKQGYGNSYEDIADAIGLIKQQLGDMPEEELESITESALLLRDTFDYDLSESIRAVDSLMSNFGVDSKAAFDLIAYGAQNGLDYSGELLDTINEYSPQFKKLGLDAQQMFNIFSSGADAGAWNLDKIGDAIKELSIRAIDMSNTTTEAYAILGLNADVMAQSFAMGGDAATGAFNMIIKGLAEIEDPVQQSIAGVNLFGTMWEDLGPEVVTQLSAIGGEAENAAGSMDKLKEAKMDSFQTQLETTKRLLQDMGIEIGLALLPYVQQLIEWINGGIEAFNGMDEKAKTFIATLVIAVSVIGLVIAIGSKVAAVIGAISAAMTFLGVSSSAALPAILAIIAALTILVALIAALNSGKKPDKIDPNDYAQDYDINSGGYRLAPSGSYASGLDYVPRDMLVQVHEGERIMTKEENAKSKENAFANKNEVIRIEAPVYLDGQVIAHNQYEYNIQEKTLRGDDLLS